MGGIVHLEVEVEVGLGLGVAAVLVLALVLFAFHPRLGGSFVSEIMQAGFPGSGFGSPWLGILAC